MNLTVGPLPPAVYWRRRALVAGGLLLLILLLAWSCGGSSGAGSTGALTSGSPSPTTSPTATPSELHPQTAPPSSGDPADPSSAPPQTPPAPAGPAVVTDTAAPMCSDDDIQLTPSVQQIVGGTFKFELTLKIKNVSSRSCRRDVGSNPQELHVTQNGQTLWSSDSCQGGTGQNNVVTFGPGIEDTFKIGWDGSGGGHCTNPGNVLKAGTYQIVAKLDSKVSQPVTFTIQ
jgi:hypothetical protein